MLGVRIPPEEPFLPTATPRSQALLVDFTSRKSLPGPGSRFLDWEVTSWAGKSLPALGSRFLRREVASWAGKSLPGLGSRFLNWEVASWAGKSLPALGSHFLAWEVTSQNRNAFSAAGSDLRSRPASGALPPLIESLDLREIADAPAPRVRRPARPAWHSSAGCGPSAHPGPAGRGGPRRRAQAVRGQPRRDPP